MATRRGWESALVGQSGTECPDQPLVERLARLRTAYTAAGSNFRCYLFIQYFTAIFCEIHLPTHAVFREAAKYFFLIMLFSPKWPSLILTAPIVCSGWTASESYSGFYFCITFTCFISCCAPPWNSSVFREAAILTTQHRICFAGLQQPATGRRRRLLHPGNCRFMQKIL